MCAVDPAVFRNWAFKFIPGGAQGAEPVAVFRGSVGGIGESSGPVE
jgi:hypothetical protein